MLPYVEAMLLFCLLKIPWVCCFNWVHCVHAGNEFLLYTTSEAAAARLGGWDDAN